MRICLVVHPCKVVILLSCLSGISFLNILLLYAFHFLLCSSFLHFHCKNSFDFAFTAAHTAVAATVSPNINTLARFVGEHSVGKVAISRICDIVLVEDRVQWIDFLIISSLFARQVLVP